VSKVSSDYAAFYEADGAAKQTLDGWRDVYVVEAASAVVL
jgi:hypothetical protein